MTPVPASAAAMSTGPLAPTPASRASAVRLMLFDVDGVLTDGRLWFGPRGEALKVFDVRDGLGIRLLHDGGVATGILSARSSPIVALRARELGIQHVVQGAADKAVAFAALLRDTGLAAAACGFMGDDWADLAVLRAVGFAASVADGAPEARALAHWVAPCDGGRGAVRALAEFVLEAQGQRAGLLARYATAAGAAHA